MATLQSSGAPGPHPEPLFFNLKSLLEYLFYPFITHPRPGRMQRDGGESDIPDRRLQIILMPSQFSKIVTLAILSLVFRKIVNLHICSLSYLILHVTAYRDREGRDRLLLSTSQSRGDRRSDRVGDEGKILASWSYAGQKALYLSWTDQLALALPQVVVHPQGCGRKSSYFVLTLFFHPVTAKISKL